MTEQRHTPSPAAMRAAYPPGGLDVDTLAKTWHEQLQRWLGDAVAAGLAEPNAMVLATVDADGRPSSRSVLCKGIGPTGVVFFTNYTSAKSRDLRSTGRAAATFPWYGLRRQAHVAGPVEPVTAEETAAYWATRPRGSQLGAWASPQSAVVPDRAGLDDALAAMARRFEAEPEVPVPPHWGGWRITVDRAEFWQGRPDRMHDRLCFERDLQRGWVILRRAP